MRRFDWDGVNLAELYFESLEGIGNPARFTPMNDDVRREFREKGRFRSPRVFAIKAAGGRRVLQRIPRFSRRSGPRMQAEWLGVLETIRRDPSPIWTWC
jgi:hypothetical protein